ACPGVNGLEDRGTLRFAPATHAERSLLECAPTFLTREPIAPMGRQSSVAPSGLKSIHLNDLLIPGLTPWATDCRPLRGLETPPRRASNSAARPRPAGGLV